MLNISVVPTIKESLYNCGTILGDADHVKDMDYVEDDSIGNSCA